MYVKLNIMGLVPEVNNMFIYFKYALHMWPMYTMFSTCLFQMGNTTRGQV